MSVTIPDSVTSIGLNAFTGCDSLTNVYFPGTEEQWNTINGIEDSNLLSDKITIHYNSSGNQDNKPVLEIDDAPYYAMTTKRLFRISPLGETSLRKPAGFVVSVNGEEFSSGKEICTSTDDVTVSIPSGYSGDIRITKAGFHDCVLPVSLTGQTNRIGMTPDSEAAPFAQAFLMDYSRGSYKNYHNLLLEGGSVYELDISGKEEPETSRLYPLINWNGHGAGRVWLKQGEKEIALTDDAFNEVCLPNEFSANQAIYLCAEAADGTVLRQTTKLNVAKRTSVDLNLNFGETIEIHTGEAEEESLDVLSNETLKIDLSSVTDKIPVSFTYKKEDGSLEGVIGIKLAEKKDTEAVFGSMKDSLSRLEKLESEEGIQKAREIASIVSDMKKTGVLNAPSSSEFGIKGDAQLLGYFTGKMVNGSPQFTEIKAALVFSGSLSYKYNTVINVVGVPVPAYFKSALSTKLDTYFKWIHDDEKGGLVLDGKRRETVSISLSLEAGPGWEGYLSGGAKGTGKLKVSMIPPIQAATTKFSLQGELAFVGSLMGVSGEWTFLKTKERIFWDGSFPGHWCWVDKDANTALLQANFVPDFTVSLMSMSGAGDAIVSGVSGYNVPQLAELSDGRLLAVWVADVTGRSVIDKGGVYFSVRNHGVWSEPALVNDDGTNDSVPQIHQENGITSIAWKNYSTIFNSNTLPDYQTVSGQIVTVSSVFDENTETWSIPTENSPDWYLAESNLPGDHEEEWPATSSVRQFLQDGAMRAVLYTEEDSNAIGQVYGLFDDGNGWGAPVQLTEAVENVNGFSAAFVEDRLAVLYTTGDYANSSLVLHEAGLTADLTLTNVDYVRQTFVPGNPMTVSVMVKNNSPVAVNGLHISVSNGSNQTYEENISAELKSGEEDSFYVNYTLPDKIDFTQFDIAVTPVSVNDADESDNSGVCKLHLTDLSLENLSATITNESTQVLAQVVNRGQTETASTTLIFRRDTPDGQEVGRETVPSMMPGDLSNITVDLNGLSADEMVYVNLVEVEDENLIGNNSSQTVVIKAEELSLDASEQARITRITTDAMSNANVEIVCEEGVSATVYCAFYDGNGRMVELEIQDLVAGSNSAVFTAGSSSAVGAKFMVLDSELRPLCASEQVTIA